jgi:hypothetical protein
MCPVGEQADGLRGKDGPGRGRGLSSSFECLRTSEYRGRDSSLAPGAGAVMFLTAMQRVFSGAHWPTDAVAGWLWGGADACSC